MYNVTVAPALFKNQHWAFPVVHEAGAAIDAMAETLKQMAQATGKSPLNNSQWDVVPAVGNSFSYAELRHFNTGQGQVDQSHPPAFAL